MCLTLISGWSLWVGYSTTLCLSFLICKMEFIIKPTSTKLLKVLNELTYLKHLEWRQKNHLIYVDHYFCVLLCMVLRFYLFFNVSFHHEHFHISLKIINHNFRWLSVVLEGYRQSPAECVVGRWLGQARQAGVKPGALGSGWRNDRALSCKR